MCHLPSCDKCQQRAPGDCGCNLPCCLVCIARRASHHGSQEPPYVVGHTTLTGKGIVATPEMVEVIASVDKHLQEILGSEPVWTSTCQQCGQALSVGSKALLMKGPGWEALPTWEDDGMGSRHDHLVARLCSVGVRAAQSARKNASVAEKLQLQKPAPAAKRGRTSQVVSHQSQQPVPNGSDREDKCPSEDDSAGDAGALGVIGPKFKSARYNQAVLLARVYVWFCKNLVADVALPSLLALFQFAGADIGQKHHHKTAADTYRGILARLLQNDLRARFRAKLPLLHHMCHA